LLEHGRKRCIPQRPFGMADIGGAQRKLKESEPVGPATNRGPSVNRKSD
jgi:hypothetical protein